VADGYQLETTADRLLLEDGSGVYVLDTVVTEPPPPPPGPGGDMRITRISHRISGGQWLVTLGFTVEGGVAQPQVTPSPPATKGATLSQLLRPVGEVTMWFGATADIPAGWLRCDGTAIPADYPDLIALIGANTPNMVDVFPIGAGTKALGTTGGDPTKVIAEANLPAHSHPYQRRAGASALGSAASAAAPSATGTLETGVTSNTGSGTPLDVMPPWRALHFIIRAR
jgi:microcystin-dependent protein